jgi:hypothetical protein
VTYVVGEDTHGTRQSGNVDLVNNRLVVECLWERCVRVCVYVCVCVCVCVCVSETGCGSRQNELLDIAEFSLGDFQLVEI